jgi:hypothetical protein
MMTSIASITRLARQTRAFSVPLLVAGALAAGCGTVAANPGGPNQPAGTASASAAASTSASASAPASATPVPTVSGGPVIAGVTACAGWPSGAPRGRLTTFFQPVAVERCVTGFQVIKGKGEWETATLEKSTENLAPLIELLLQPSARVQPGVYCPEFAVIPPQLLLISSTGKELIPQLPMGGCGTVNAHILTTLSAMSWQPVSVRLISKVSPAATTPPRTLPGASIGPGAPHPLRTGGPAAAAN